MAEVTTDAIYALVKQMHACMGENHQAVQRLDQRFAREEDTMADLSKSLASIRIELDRLDERMARIERRLNPHDAVTD